ncbi:MAG TPA: ornithine acetyltransferase, partial [Lachnospiraceae bacterium]|nr:ornithine acetyltransferase [Lachnospiraceae bacterium]
MEKITGGVTAAQGFRAASTAAGIKYKDRKDMAMIVSEVPCRAAGTFTTNLVKAAPVLWDREIVRGSGTARAVVVNAGIANACTGSQGMDYCRQT